MISDTSAKFSSSHFAQRLLERLLAHRLSLQPAFTCTLALLLGISLVASAPAATLSGPNDIIGNITLSGDNFLDDGASINIITKNSLIVSSGASLVANSSVSGVTLNISGSSSANSPIINHGLIDFYGVDISLASAMFGSLIYNNGSLSIENSRISDDLATNWSNGNLILMDNAAAITRITDSDISLQKRGSYADQAAITILGGSFILNNSTLDILKNFDCTTTASLTARENNYIIKNTGIFTAENGSVLDINNNMGRIQYGGQYAQGVGIYNTDAGQFFLSGENTTLNLTNSGLHGILNRNGATFTINEGATLAFLNNASISGGSTAGNISMGIFNDGPGSTFIVTGAGSTLNATTIYAGPTIVNTGTFIVSDQATLNTTRSYRYSGYNFDNNSTLSHLYISNATVNSFNDIANSETPTIQNLGTITLNATATFNATGSGYYGHIVNNGTISITEGSKMNLNTTRLVNVGPDAAITVQGANSTLAITATIIGVENLGGATFQLLDGAILSLGNASNSDTAYNFSNTLGNVTISGIGTKVESENLSGTGISNNSTLLIKDGATLNSTSSSSFRAGIANTYYGTLIISGSDTLVNATQDSASGNGYAITNSGNFTIKDGATLNLSAKIGTAFDNYSGNILVTGTSTRIYSELIDPAGTGSYNYYGTGIRNYNGTFTLSDGASIETTNYYGNSIYNLSGNFIMSGGASIKATVNSNENADATGIRSAKSYSNDPVPTFTVTGQDTTITLDVTKGTGLYANFTLSDGASITATVDTGAGIHAYGNTIITGTGTTVTATTNNSNVGLYTLSVGIWNRNDLLVSDGARIDSTTYGEYGIYNDGGDITVTGTGTELTTKVLGTHVFGTGINNDGNFTLSGGASLHSEVHTQYTDGIWNHGGNNFLVTGTGTKLTSISSNESRGIFTFSNFTLSDGASLVSTNNGGSGISIYNGGEYGHRFLVTGADTTLNATNTGDSGTAIYNYNHFFIVEDNAFVDIVTKNGSGFENLANIPTIPFENADTNLIVNSATLNVTTTDGGGGIGIFNSGANITATGNAKIILNNTTLYSDVSTISLDYVTVNITIGIDDWVGGNTSTDGDITVPGTSKSNLIAPQADRIVLKDSATIDINENSRLIINNASSSLTAETALNFFGGNHLIAGNGTFSGNGVLDNMAATTRLSPGSFNPAKASSATGSSIGTLKIIGAQSWNAFTYDWQINAASPTAYDRITLSDTLTLGGTYTLNLLPLNTGTLTANTYDWILISATSITDNDAGSWTLANETAFRSALGLGAGTLSVLYDNNNVLLRYLLAISDYYWAPNTPSNTYNGSSTFWENTNMPPANAAGATIHFVRDQDTAGVIINLNGTQTIGNLTIGSENGTSTNFTLTNGTLSFDNLGNSSLITHHQNANNDTISANITLQNDLTLQTLAANSNLTITGTLSSNNHSINKTGTGTLITTSDINLGTGTFTLEQGHTRLHTGTLTASLITVKSGASIGGNSSLNGNITFEENAIILNDRRLGAKYSDRFQISDTASFNGNSSFTNLANFSSAVSGDGRVITTEMNCISASVLNLNAAATYTLNLYNEGTYDITDWTQVQDTYGIYYALVLSGSLDNINGFDGTTWKINLMDASGNAWTGDGIWEIVKGTQGGMHGIWLHYTNPSRIPEPTTTAAIIASIALLATLIAKRRKRK